MTSRPRGLALIIEIEEYENDVQERRTGSEVDVHNLQKLFEALSFKVEHRKNLSRKEFDSELLAFSRDRKHAAADMMILAILSHGRDGHIYASDGAVIGVESIYEKFNNQHCPALKGKPKFFIIQACRGDETDSAAAMYGDEASGDLAEAAAANVPPNAKMSKKRRIGKDILV